MDAYLYRKQLNDYWFGINANPQGFDECEEYLTAKIKSIPEGKSFIFITDTHNRDGNAEQSPALIGYIRALTNAKKVIMGGDILGREANRYLAVCELKKYINRMTDIAGKDLLMVFGNHDLNTANSPEELVEEHRIPYVEMEKALFSHTDERVCEDISEKIKYLKCSEEERQEILAFSRLHYYIDDKENKIRYIIVETGNQLEFGRNGCVTKYFDVYNNEDLVMQYDWMYETLMSTPEDYDVVVSGHALTGYCGHTNIWKGPLGICKILSGFKTCSKVTVDNPCVNYEKLAKFYAKGPHEYDFTSRKNKSNVVVIAGDTHIDVQAKADYDENGNFVSTPYIPGEKLNETAVIVNTTQPDSYRNIFSERAYKMYKDTITEQCLDVVTICPDGNIKLTRIGAGEDRKIEYK